jgi:hypothetical protein
MSGRAPDFETLVGSDLDAAEDERLRRVHDLLVEAGPPPDLPARAPVTPLARRRRRGALLAVAAALAVAAFALGVAVGDSSRERSTDFVVEMNGTASAADASASVIVYELDDAGNWPMEVAVAGLVTSGSGHVFELWLTKQGEPISICGSFLTKEDGTASVPMNAPWPLDDFDGWIIVEQGSETPLLTT